MNAQIRSILGGLALWRDISSKDLNRNPLVPSSLDNDVFFVCEPYPQTKGGRY